MESISYSGVLLRIRPEVLEGSPPPTSYAYGYHASGAPPDALPQAYSLASRSSVDPDFDDTAGDAVNAADAANTAAATSGPPRSAFTVPTPPATGGGAGSHRDGLAKHGLNKAPLGSRPSSLASIPEVVHSSWGAGTAARGSSASTYVFSAAKDDDDDDVLGGEIEVFMQFLPNFQLCALPICGFVLPVLQYKTGGPIKEGQLGSRSNPMQ